MAEKIGFLRFTMLDPPSPTEYAAYKKLERRLEPGGHVKSIAELYPPYHPFHTEAAGLNRTPDMRLYKFAAELAPWMDEYHDRVRDLSRLRAQIKAIDHARMQKLDNRYIDTLHEWISELLFARIYQRLGRNHQLFERVAKRATFDAKFFHAVHREKRMAEAEHFPKLLQKDLVDPFRFEIREPNVKKLLQKSIEHAAAEHQLQLEARFRLHTLRQKLFALLYSDIQQQLLQRGDDERRVHLHLHDVQHAFEKAWTQAWDTRDNFRLLVRQGIVEQAEYYPRLYRAALRNPFEIAIRVPNDKDFQQRIREHLDEERKQLELEKQERLAERKLNQEDLLERAGWRHFTAEKIAEQERASQDQAKDLRERRNRSSLEQQDAAAAAVRAESQGYDLLAGLVPHPPLLVHSDYAARVPLPLGLHGVPRAPTRLAPLPLQLLPEQQKALWHKLRAADDAAQSTRVQGETQAWQEKMQRVRQGFAAMEYAEQQTRELQQSNGPRTEPAALPDTASVTAIDQPQAPKGPSRK